MYLLVDVLEYHFELTQISHVLINTQPVKNDYSGRITNDHQPHAYLQTCILTIVNHVIYYHILLQYVAYRTPEIDSVLPLASIPGIYMAMYTQLHVGIPYSV